MVVVKLLVQHPATTEVPSPLSAPSPLSGPAEGSSPGVVDTDSSSNGLKRSQVNVG